MSDEIKIVPSSRPMDNYELEAQINDHEKRLEKLERNGEIDLPPGRVQYMSANELDKQVDQQYYRELVKSLSTGRLVKFAVGASTAPDHARDICAFADEILAEVKRREKGG